MCICIFMYICTHIPFIWVLYKRATEYAPTIENRRPTASSSLKQPGVARSSPSALTTSLVDRYCQHN